MKLSRDYNRAEFSMVYNNLLRSKEVKRIQELKGYAVEKGGHNAGVSEEALKFGLLHLWEQAKRQ